MPCVPFPVSVSASTVQPTNPKKKLHFSLCNMPQHGSNFSSLFSFSWLAFFPSLFFRVSFLFPFSLSISSQSPSFSVCCKPPTIYRVHAHTVGVFFCRRCPQVCLLPFPIPRGHATCDVTAYQLGMPRMRHSATKDGHVLLLFCAAASYFLHFRFFFLCFLIFYMCVYIMCGCVCVCVCCLCMNSNEAQSGRYIALPASSSSGG